MKILAFGAAKDIIGRSEMIVHKESGWTVGSLKEKLVAEYPGLQRLNSMAIAVNETYAVDGLELNDADVVALIPPVSGG